MRAWRWFWRRVYWFASGCTWRTHVYDEHPDSRWFTEHGHRERFRRAVWRCTRCNRGPIVVSRGGQEQGR